MTATTEIHVTPWRTPQGTQEDPTAQWHDCLWEVASEQATLEYMEKNNVTWDVAAGKITGADIRRHLDKICDDNGFRHIDGTGSGRDPNLIGDGDPIKVERNPLVLTTMPQGLSVGEGSQALDQYNQAMDGPTNTNLAKKTELDAFLKSIPDLAKLSDETQAALIAAYRRGVDKGKLAALTGTEAFRQLKPEQQTLLLKNYGAPGHETSTAAIDKGVAENPKADPEGKLLKILQGTLGPYNGTAIPAGTTLKPGQSFTSADGKTKLTMQEDGNLVMYVNGKAVWSTNTSFWGNRNGPSGDHAVWQADGNFVLYASDGKTAWSSKTEHNDGARLVIQDNKLVIYDKNDKQIWASR